METKIKNTIALITGGASGIGKAVVTRIIDGGGRVIIVDTDPAGQEVAKSFGDRAKFFKADVSSEQDIKESLKFAIKVFGAINVVINSAGIAAFEDPYNFETNEPHSLDLFKKLMNVNVFGTFNVTRLCAGIIAANPPDENNQRGVIINISSVLAFDAPAFTVAYAATKAAVAGMTTPLARAFGAKGIRVVAVAPGFTETPMAAGVAESSIHQFASIDVINMSPKRHADPDEIAHLMQCIIENAFINGELIRIDGGYRHAYPPTK